MKVRWMLPSILGLALGACSTDNSNGVKTVGTGGTVGSGGESVAGGPTASGGASSAGGTSASGGVSSTGGSGSGGTSAPGGATTAVGGANASGGATGSGGAVGRDAGVDGATRTGGATSAGGATGPGGAIGTGGAARTGGTVGAGGGTTTDGGVGTGGRTGAGGATAAGGATSAGGATATGGATVINPGQCDATTTPVARHGKLSIKGNQVVNQCGRPVQFTSMSMYDWSQQGRQFYNANAVKNLAGTGTGQMKCTTLRIPLLAANYPSQYPRMKTVMDACIANGIYCIPNWHVIGASNVTNAKAFYVQLANDYGTVPNILYEPWNEPTTTAWTDIKAYHEEIMTAVRAIDPDNIFLLGTRQWDQRPDEACATPVADGKNVAYVFHFYANSHTLSGFQSKLDACLNKNLAIWSTEYGGVSSNGNGTFNVAETNKWWAYMDKNLISSNNWAIETNGETSSVFTKTANANGPWTDAELTDSGRNVFPHVAAGYAITMSQ
jgi:endoglucanase